MTYEQMITLLYEHITLVPPSCLDSPLLLFYCGYMESPDPATLLSEIVPPGTPEVRYPYQEGRAVAKLRYSHEAMIDLIVANPWVSQGELAATFGYTQAWVSLVMSSDAFKERLSARKAELVDPTIAATLNERWAAVEKRSLEVLAEKLSQPISAVPEALALRAAELGAKVRGVGAPQVVIPQTNRLDELAQRLVSFIHTPHPVYDVTPTSVSE
jgi:hypothetical protein